MLEPFEALKTKISFPVHFPSRGHYAGKHSERRTAVVAPEPDSDPALRKQILNVL